jgi:SAM-dependent methyltransferase
MNDAHEPSTVPIACRVCGSRDCLDCGPPVYREPLKVAGVPIDLSDLRLAHVWCRSCGYRFVHPPIPDDRLLECYRQTPQHHWGTEVELAEERYYARKRELIEQHAPGRRILDFGCYDGGFLHYLGGSWQRFGIEPSPGAAAIAESRGVTMLGPTVESLGPRSVEPFDAIVAFDVIEHLGEPVQTLQLLSQMLRTGGIMLIETGDTGSPHFRRVGKLYPYCALVEHVGFFGRDSVAEAGIRAGMRLAHFEPSRHSTTVDSGFPFGWLYDSAYWTLRAARAVRLPLPARWRRMAQGPVPRPLSARDHFLAVLRKV